jgi:hypothetical protein
VSSQVYVAYSTGLWSWRQIDYVSKNKEGLRDKIMQPLDMKGWVTSKQAKHTFHADQLAGKVEEFQGNPDLKWSEYQIGVGYPSAENPSAVSPNGARATTVVNGMKNQAKVMGNKLKAAKYGSISTETSADALCCFALYDPIGIAADLAYQGNSLHYKIQKIVRDNARGIFVSNVLDQIYTDSLSLKISRKAHHY